MDSWWQNFETIYPEVKKYILDRRQSPPATADNWPYEVVKYSIEGPIAYVKLDDLRNANGLTSKMTSALMDICFELNDRPDVKVVVFTAGGSYFCTGGAFGGADADDFRYALHQPNASARDSSIVVCMSTATTFYLLSNLKQFKVAAIRGANMGAGNSLIASMDYVVAPMTKKTKMDFKEATRGLAACISWQGIMAKVGIPNTRKLTLISDAVDPYEAMQYGLVSEVFEGSSTDLAQKGADERAKAKGAEVAALPDNEILQQKTTGVGCPTRLLEIPAVIKDSQALKADKPTPQDYLRVADEVIKKCGRTGRPAPARLSNEMWIHKAVQFEQCGQHVAAITLNRPTAGNSINRAMVNGLLDAAIELHKGVGKVRLVLVKSTGNVFCSGLDASLPADDEQLQQMLFLLYLIPMYVVGVVEGGVSGAGVTLCSTFDTIYASKSASFSFGGLPTAGCGSEYVAARLGRPLLAELVGQSQWKTVDEAQKMLLVQFIFASEAELDQRVEALCEKVSRCAPNAVAQSKAWQQNCGSRNIDMDMLIMMSAHVDDRQNDPEFQDSINAIVIEGHVPAYNRYDHNKVVPPHLATGGKVAALQDGPAPAPRPKKPAAPVVSMSVMI